MAAPVTARRAACVAEALANEPLCREHFRLVLRAEDLPPSAPGQFVQLQCRHLRPQVTAREVVWAPGSLPTLTQPELIDKEPMLRRPLSIGGRRGAEIDIIYRTVGTGTRWLSSVRAGDRLSLLGPLGNGFSPGAEELAVLVGGGVGIPPVLYLANELAAAGRRAVAFCGARTRDLLPLRIAGKAPSPAGRPEFCVEELSRVRVSTAVATDDGSAGFAGMVSEALRAFLNANAPNPASLAVYACGPEPMERAIAEICLSRGYRCQLALERHMACGVGTCQSCVVKLRRDVPGGWAFGLCCTDGPVFDARELLW